MSVRCVGLTLLLLAAAVFLSSCCQGQGTGSVPVISGTDEQRKALEERSSTRDTGLAATPLTGCNIWDFFVCNIDEQLIRDTTNAIVSGGMPNAGYAFVIIDDCWHGELNALGDIQPDAKRFSNGMGKQADRSVIC